MKKIIIAVIIVFALSSLVFMIDDNLIRAHDLYYTSKIIVKDLNKNTLLELNIEDITKELKYTGRIVDGKKISKELNEWEIKYYVDFYDDELLIQGEILENNLTNMNSITFQHDYLPIKEYNGKQYILKLNTGKLLMKSEFYTLLNFEYLIEMIVEALDNVSLINH